MMKKKEPVTRINVGGFGVDFRSIDANRPFQCFILFSVKSPAKQKAFYLKSVECRSKSQ